MNLVSSTYQGIKISSPFKKTPNLSELNLGGVFCESFPYEPNKHSSYSVQLVKLVLTLHTVKHERPIVAPLYLPQLHSLKRLELNIVSQVTRSLLFFTLLIKASPLLHEFKIKIRDMMPFPEVTEARAPMFHHKNLKVVEMDG